MAHEYEPTPGEQPAMAFGPKDYDAPQDDAGSSSFDDEFTGPFNPGDPSHANNGINLQNGKVEAQPVNQAYDFYYMPSDTKGRHRHHHHHRRRSSSKEKRPRQRRTRKRRGLPAWAIVLISLLAVAIVAAAVWALLFWRSVQSVSAQASAAVSQATEIKASFKDGDFTSMSASVQRMEDAAHNMRDEVNGPMWNAAAVLPPFTGDIGKVRELADIFCDLVDNGAAPLIDSLNDRSLSDVLGNNGYIDLPLLNSFIGGLEKAAVVIDRDLAAVNNVGSASIKMVNDRMEQARLQMNAIDGMLDRTLRLLRPLPAMLGDGGQTRRYIINAQQPADERAGGGTNGTTGLLEITDGHLSLGVFNTFYPNDVGTELLPQALPEELAVLGEGVRSNPGNASMTPDYPRAANLFAQAWCRDNGMPVNGVISMDPVFLQWCLRYVGSVSASVSWDTFDKEGEFLAREMAAWTIDGKNASQVLSHEVYQAIEQIVPQETLFSDYAHKALDLFMNNLNKVGFKDFIELMQKAGQERRFKIWMLNEDEEMTMRELGLSGVLQHVTTEAPELGVYVNDYTWGQMGWFLDLQTKVGDAVQNADGSRSYPVTTTVHNTMSIEEAKSSTITVIGVNPTRRNEGDMCTELMLFAPAGGYISDVVMESTYPVFAPWPARMYDLDLVSMRFWTNLGETSRVTYTVTTSPDAHGNLVVRQTPTCRTF